VLLSLISLSLLLAVWALSASRLERWRITSPMFLLLAGAVVEYTTHGSLADLLDSETAEQAAKIILAVLLFVDANAMRAGLFGEHPRSATRLLFVALPLSVGFAVLLGLWLLPGLSLATVVVIACIVVPIDFAPAQWIVRPGGVPGRVSDLLNVEAGYNDGILSPIFIFALAVADQHVQAGSAWDEVRQAFPHSAKAILVGLVVGAGLAMAANGAERKGLMTDQSRRLLVVAAPALAYTLTIWWHGNGFVAAFLCGIGYHYYRHSVDAERELELLEDLSFLLTALMWFVFGGVVFIAYWNSGLTVGVVVFCLLALTVVRMLPVLLSMLGSKFTWRERVLLGGLGPRGAAAIVLGLLAFNVLDSPDADTILMVVVVVVLGSVVLHGFGGPIAARALASRESE